MSPPSETDQGVLRLAERLIQLLEEGRFAATYKFALLVALIDLCFEGYSEKALPPETVTTRQLAEKVIELYWPHTVPYREAGVLRQGTAGPGGQADILRKIQAFREVVTRNPAESLPLSRARTRVAQEGWEDLVRFVEWKLIEMPLPRLQFLGKEEDRFLYDIGWRAVRRPGGWRASVRRREVARYQRGDGSAFDNRIRFRPGVSEQLVRLSGVLRPLIHRQWAVRVARMNRLEEYRLELVLFGCARAQLAPVRPGLRELQDNRCFYCGESIDGSHDVDHFIPWSRHPDNSIDNLVVAHSRCNNRKRDFLAAAEHVEHWRARSAERASDLRLVAGRANWESSPLRTLSVGRAVYLHLPGGVRLWRLEDEFVPMDRPRIVRALGVHGRAR